MSALPWSDVVSVEYLGGHRLHLKFADGLEGTVDFAYALSFEGVFAPLKDPAEFARARVDQELGTVVWPNGADLAPESLYERVKTAVQPHPPPG